jgi:hypothetical protein
MKTIKLINSMDKYVFSSLHLINMSLFIEKPQKFSGEKYKSVDALVVFFYLGWCQIPRLSANKICSSSQSQNTAIPDFFNSYKHFKIYIVISTFANKNILRKFFNHRRCSFSLV